MSSEGPYGRHGFNANAGAYGGQAGGGYAAPNYGGGGQYGASYSAPGSGGYAGAQYGQGAPMDYNQVRWKWKERPICLGRQLSR
jgi:hypothetical protein